MSRLPDELIIVDNSAGDPATEELARVFSARYILEPTLGLSRARNRGLSCSNSELVVYIDDDAVPDVNWLERLVEPFSDSRLAVATGKVIAMDSVGSESESTPFVLSKADRYWFEIAAWGGLGIGANMAFRKSVCGTDRIFDERLGRGAPFHEMEENHAFVQLLSRGFSAAHIPNAIVYHSSHDMIDVERESRNRFAYSMLLFSEFANQRLELLRFLYRRMRHKPLIWRRDSPAIGVVVGNSRWSLLKASMRGVRLYFTTRPKRVRGTVVRRSSSITTD